MIVVLNRQVAVSMSYFCDKPTRLPEDAMVGICMPASVATMEIKVEELLRVGEPQASLEHDFKLGEDFKRCREQVIAQLKDFSGI